MPLCRMAEFESCDIAYKPRGVATQIREIRLSQAEHSHNRFEHLDQYLLL
jgi:hypothetical protein